MLQAKHTTVGRVFRRRRLTIITVREFVATVRADQVTRIVGTIPVSDPNGYDNVTCPTIGTTISLARSTVSALYGKRTAEIFTRNAPVQLPVNGGFTLVYTVRVTG